MRFNLLLSFLTGIVTVPWLTGSMVLFYWGLFAVCLILVVEGNLPQFVSYLLGIAVSMAYLAIVVRPGREP